MRTHKCVPALLAAIVLAALLAACDDREALKSTGVPGTPSATRVGPGYVAGMPQPPSPTATPATGASASPGPAGIGPEPFSSTVISTTTVAGSPVPDWTCYQSINEVRKLLFAADGALWAITNGGLLRWNLDTGTYTRYLIDAGDLAFAPDGTLWLAGGYGLCRFDGQACDPLDVGEDPGTGAILAVAVTPDGAVWAGTERGVSRFDGQAWQHYPSNVPTHDLAVGSGGEVWAATAGGLGRYLPSQDTWVTYADNDGMSGLQASALAVGPAGDVWVSFLWQGLARFDGEGWHAVEQPPGGIVSAITLAADGTPWVGTVGSMHYPGGALSHWNGETWVDVTGEHGLTSIASVALGPEGTVAASTNLGLGIYQGGKWRLLRDGPLSDRVTSVAVTDDAAAWFAFGDYSSSTEFRGLSSFDGREWTYLLEDAEVATLAVAPDGSLWAGAGCSVLRFDAATWQTVARCEDLPPGNVFDIEFTADGAAWVANGFGLARFDSQGWTVYDRLANSLVAAPDGAIWVNGWDGSAGSDYVAHFDGQEWTAHSSDEAFPGRFKAGAVTPDGRLWGIVPERGLASFDGRSWTEASSWVVVEPPPDILLGGRLAVAPDGALWMEASGGVTRFDPAAAGSGEQASSGAWTFYGAGDPLCPAGYWPVAFGPQGEVWLGATRFLPAP